MSNEQADRNNDGKIRYDLLEPFAIEQLASVFTKGAQKYAPYNWLKGMKWSKMLASLKRHIAAFEKGEDFDKETGLPHMAHAGWNALGLVSYMKYHPEFDDRIHTYLKPLKIGLDVDEVLADWVGAWCRLHNLPQPTAWSFDRYIRDKFNKMKYEGSLDKFYLSLERKVNPDDIPFEPAAYITSRPVDTSITEEWLDKNGFPVAPVYTVGLGKSKAETLKEAGVDLFVDDSYNNYTELNRAGVCTYLWDAPHNRRYNVGHKRLKSFKDLI